MFGKQNHTVFLKLFYISSGNINYISVRKEKYQWDLLLQNTDIATVILLNVHKYLAYRNFIDSMVQFYHFYGELLRTKL